MEIKSDKLQFTYSPKNRDDVIIVTIHGQEQIAKLAAQAAVWRVAHYLKTGGQIPAGGIEFYETGGTNMKKDSAKKSKVIS